jgi:hypothetical protein
VTDVNLPVVAVVAPTVPLMLMLAVPVRLVTTPDAGVPSAGVTKVGDVANTAEPVPVSSVSAVANCAEVKEPRDAAFPTEVTIPVRLALVVTLLAVKAVAVPVMFVPTNADGVPSAGVTRVGLFDSTTFVVPVEVVTPVPPLATARVPARVTAPVVAVFGVNPVVPAENDETTAEAAVLAQLVPLDVSKLPEVPGDTVAKPVPALFPTTAA